MKWARSDAPVEVDIAAGRKGSVLAARAAAEERAARGQQGRSSSSGGGRTKLIPGGMQYPTNEEVVKAVQERVEATVDLCRSYRNAVLYMLFVVVYMAVLYFQAHTFNAAPVVSTLKAALLDNPSVNTLQFSSPDQVLAYLGNRVVRPMWTDPVCGDGRCEAPWEFPAWGPFGCRADCGRNPNTTGVLVGVTADFAGHPSLSPRALMTAVRWNLCRDDPDRRLRGEPDLCWFENDQVFTQFQETQIQSVSLVDGTWYVRVLGDYAGRVKGTIYRAPPTGATGIDPEAIPTEPVWTSCLTKRRSTPPSNTSTTPAATAVRRLREAVTKLENAAGGKEQARQLLGKAVTQALHAERQRRRALAEEG